MSEGAANEQEVGEVHKKVTKLFNTLLDGTDYVDEESGETVNIPPDPRLISAAVSFLNNNKCTMSPFIDNNMGIIEQKIEKLRQDKKKRLELVRQKATEDAKKTAEFGG